MGLDDPRSRLVRDGKSILFLAVATGQGIANVPPILEVAKDGDFVLWLETPEAARKGFANGSDAVLKRKFNGLRTERVAISDAPKDVCATLVNWLNERGVALALQGHSAVLVGNGGPKPISSALGHLLEKAPGTFGTIYGQDQPAELRVMPDGAMGDLFRYPYQRVRHRLTFEDILACSGHVLAKDSKPIKLWPHAANVATLGHSYTLDVESTRNLHERHYRRGKLKEEIKTGLAHFGSARDFLTDRVQNWRRDLTIKGAQAITSDKVAEGIFNSTLNISRDAYYKCKLAAAGLDGLPTIGDLFEQAVAQRVQRWLTTDGKTMPICEAWLNVGIARITTPNKSAQQLDIVFVLANGVVLSLECKTFDAEKKDIDARLLNLHQSGSRLARLVICAPVYTQFSNEEWFLAIHENVEERFKPFGPFIGFTLCDQSDQYTIAINGVSQQFTCAPFEESLARLFEPYSSIPSS